MGLWNRQSLTILRSETSTIQSRFVFLGCVLIASLFLDQGFWGYITSKLHTGQAIIARYCHCNLLFTVMIKFQVLIMMIVKKKESNQESITKGVICKYVLRLIRGFIYFFGTKWSPQKFELLITREMIFKSLESLFCMNFSTGKKI